MNAVELYQRTSLATSQVITRLYSTSFSLGVRTLHPRYRAAVHAIYGFVRLADEIVDTFTGHDRADLLTRFRHDTHRAVQERISLNPILHSFQWAVHRYGIEAELYDTFLDSMAMDLTTAVHQRPTFDRYVRGSAEYVGCMCLRVFLEQDPDRYETLKPAAQRLGAAFQKINFLRDLQDDHRSLGRSYFPGLDPVRVPKGDLATIRREITADLAAALPGIRALPDGVRPGVYLTYLFYRALLHKLGPSHFARSTRKRVSLHPPHKLALLTSSYVKHRLNLI